MWIRIRYQIWAFFTKVWYTSRGQTGKIRILNVFWAQSTQFFNYKKINLYGINPHTNVIYMQNLRFLNWTVWRTACGQTWKNGFWHVFCAQSAQFLKYEKITLYGINPHTNVTYMQSLGFLHWRVCRKACGQSWNSDFGRFFGRKAPNF